MFALYMICTAWDGTKNLFVTLLREAPSLLLLLEFLRKYNDLQGSCYIKPDLINPSRQLANLTAKLIPSQFINQLKVDS